MAGQEAAEIQLSTPSHQHAKNQANREKNQVQGGDAIPMLLQPVHVREPLFWLGLRGECDAPIAGAPGCFHHIDHGLMRGFGISVNNDGALWNSLVDGFGNHDPGAGRYKGLRPRWDVLHPGRSK